MRGNHRCRVNHCSALYNGRTKEYLGHQTFQFDPKAWENEYSSFAKLTLEIGKVVSAERAGLLSLVPEIANVISKEQR